MAETKTEVLEVENRYLRKAVEEIEQLFKTKYAGYEIEESDEKQGIRIMVRETPQMAERRMVVEELFKQLNEFVPNWRRALKKITAKQLEEFYNKAFESINFDNVWNYIQNNKKGLQLKKSEVPKRLWFQLILFGIYGREKFGYADWNDKKIFDVSDDETDENLTSIEDLLKIRRNGLIFNLRKEAFFERIVEIRDFLELLEKTGF